MTGSGEREDAGEMSSGSTCREVVLHVYDVTKTVRKINRFFKDGVGVGGIFHSAVQVPAPLLLPAFPRRPPRTPPPLPLPPPQIPKSHAIFLRTPPATQVYGEEEWSFGFCETGSGVLNCPVGKNPMYTYRERIVLGETECGIAAVNRILRELSREWPGHSYDLLSRNCNHFCDVLCERLGVPKLPGEG